MQLKKLMMVLVLSCGVTTTALTNSNLINKPSFSESDVQQLFVTHQPITQIAPLSLDEMKSTQGKAIHIVIAARVGSARGTVDYIGSNIFSPEPWNSADFNKAVLAGGITGATVTLFPPTILGVVGGTTLGGLIGGRFLS